MVRPVGAYFGVSEPQQASAGHQTAEKLKLQQQELEVVVEEEFEALGGGEWGLARCET